MYNRYTYTDEVGAMHIDKYNRLPVTGNYYHDFYFFNHSGRNNGTVPLKLYTELNLPWYVSEAEECICKALGLDFKPSPMYLVTESLDNACIAISGKDLDDIISYLDNNIILDVYHDLFDYKDHQRAFMIFD